jgi:hypothetical protein
MAATLNGSIGPAFSINWTGAPDAGKSSYTLATPLVLNFADGAAAGQARRYGLAKGTAAAAPVDVDITSLKDQAGNTQTWTQVNGILIRNTSTVDANVLLWDGTVTNALSGPFDDIVTAKIPVKPGIAGFPGCVLQTAMNTTGFTVDGTHKIISLDPGAATIGYEVYLLGR